MLPQPQVWPRRQKMPQQLILTEPAPMEGIERINTTMVSVIRQKCEQTLGLELGIEIDSG